MKHFNQLTPAETERLALLAEECAETIQVIGKILRHGYASCHPNDLETPNRTLLTDELGHIQAALQLMEAAGDIHPETIEQSCATKLQKVGRYLHHNMPSAESAAPAKCKTCGGSGMTAGWVPTYGNPDNAGGQQEAEPCPDCEAAPAKHPDTEGERLGSFATACHKCGAQTMDPFTGTKQIHDVERCNGKARHD